MPVQVDVLAGLPLFSGLSTIELEEIACHLDIDEAGNEAILIREGDEPNHPIYILLDGSVEVLKHGIDGRDHVISSLSAPSVFGEIEVLAHRPAIAGVRTTSPVKFARLNRGVFDELCADNRACILKVIKNLASTLAYRLAATDGRLAAYFSIAHPDSEAIGQMHSLLYSTWHTDEDS